MPAMTGVTIAVIVLAIAALVLFLAPGFIRNLGAGEADRSQAPGASPTAATGASPSASATPSSTPTPSLYIVQSGDTLSDIAERFGISLVALREANAERLPDPNNLQIGDELIIPPAGTTPRPSGSASSSGSPLP
jgi:LysM repeat protein